MALRVCVVGSGVSGSIFSALLRRTGIVYVDVFDRANRPGGRYTSTQVRVPFTSEGEERTFHVDLGGQFIRSSEQNPNGILNRFLAQMPGVDEHVEKVFSDKGLQEGLDQAVRKTRNEGYGVNPVNIGVVGAKGGFIPLELVKMHGEMMREVDGYEQSMNFCDLVKSRGDLYFARSGKGIGELFERLSGGVEGKNSKGRNVWNAEITQITRNDHAQWEVVDKNKQRYGPYDFVVHATHNTA